ncbi:Hemin transport system permease protein HmuU [uncultured delta proteobacterium]|uniref:Hemin transport system permease protein HmuU n=1 Tax=uncultured delta proteobacterium TaxID=34034 RepID=A0A212JT51_9DELT|nr:Hemin transport system permease protein HmuU [uncultured delta proteobacterium]
MGIPFRAVCMALLGLLLLTALAVAMVAGAYDISLAEVWKSVAAHLTGNDAPDIPKVRDVIVWKIRMPRLLLAAVSGMALAVSGAAYQGCFRNPLVEPYILGVSSGAACGAALAILFPAALPPVPLSAFIFALLAVSITGLLATSRGVVPPVALVLAGIIVGALFSAGVGVMKYLAADTQLREITFWMMGGFHYASWPDTRLTAALVLPGIGCIWLLGWRLNVLSLGDEDARSLGVNPARLRRLLVVLATVCAAACVASAGIIGWVGLMAPHAARMLFGPDNRWVIPASALMGAVYLLVCDTLARTLTQAEIPVSIITAVLGAPYLLWLLRVKGRELYGN